MCSNLEICCWDLISLTFCSYRGNCVIIISDSTCTPHPPIDSKTGKAEHAYDGNKRKIQIKIIKINENKWIINNKITKK